MRKLWLLILLAAAFALALVPPAVAAYSPHYLPGGTNYLSPDNFERESGYYTSIYPFLIKPNTTYCLALPGEYTVYQQYDVLMEFYDDAAFISDLTLTEVDFYIWESTTWEYVVFTTPAQANYLDLFIFEPDSYFATHGIEGFQLEEGEAFTGYEAYIEGSLADINGPYFSGNGVVVTNVDDHLPAAAITAGLSATDAIDGDVTASIVVVSDGYSANIGVLGSYIMTYRVADAAGNTTEFQITVLVVDVTAPMFGGVETICVPYPAVMTIASIQEQINASDNYDGNLDDEITLQSDGYSANAATLGSYQVVFAVTDTSGNVAAKTVTIEVVDETAPIFSGPASYTIGYDNSLTVATIEAALSVLDDYDADLTATISVKSDGYSAHMKKIGAYTVVFQAADSSGNVSEYTVLVNVVDSIGPVVYVDASIVRVYNSTVLTLEDFTTLLIRAGELPWAEGYMVSIRFDSYSSHALTPGIYHLALDIVSPEGALSVKTFQIFVAEPPVTVIPDPGPGTAGGETFASNLKAYIVGGALILVLVASNAIWFFKMKKR
ncbi:MAG: hypothetical protein V1761_03880 [bacterium]